MQENLFPLLLHVPEFKHGEELHGSSTYIKYVKQQFQGTEYGIYRRAISFLFHAYVITHGIIIIAGNHLPVLTNIINEIAIILAIFTCSTEFH